jgi:hypothetical protein
MLQLHNNTPFAASMALFPNEEAIDTLYVMVKASFSIADKLTLTDEQAKPVAADVYWTEPGKSSLKYASDFHTGKPATDIIMLGHACTPGKQEATQLDVQVSVGQVNKAVRVYGDRQWRDGQMTRPATFTTMPMVYERAYGGVRFVDGRLAESETRNPVGRGFAGSRKTEEMNGVPLPNLEDPSNLIASPQDQPAPACFAASAPNWQPRVGFAGTYDEKWQTTRAPYLPEDFDKRFLNVAHPDLVYPDYLQGGESVRITNMHPRGDLDFEVPRVQMISLETLILEPNQLQMSLVWRASVSCDKQALKISEIKIALMR